ncbi:uncharacterized protein LOC134822826 [Bolinopsis microptera]|uniref:uncharacterized protein LOC134822826 n=1 Tax=Bolinopsis microptera TaxID=2820187 RepID=UPI00307A5174
MVQVIKKEENVPILNYKLKLIYFVIIVTAMVVIYMLTFGERGTSYQEGQIHTDNRMNSKSVEVETFSEVTEEGTEQSDLDMTASLGSIFPTSSANVYSTNSLPQQIDGGQQPVIQDPQLSQVQQPEQSVIQQPDQTLVQQPVQPQQSDIPQPVPQQPLENQPQPVIPQVPQTPLQPVGQCPALDMGGIHDRITKSCEVDRFKNNWVELVAMYDIAPHHLLYDVDRNYVWVTVPKIASSNIKRVIIKEKFGYEEGSEEMEHALFAPHVTLAKCCLLTAEVAREFYSLQRAFTFAFIRNPWTRLYSAYKDKIVKFKGFDDYYYIKKILFTVRDWTWEEVKNEPAVREAAGTITFTDFLTMLATTDAENFNDHWKPWFLLTQPCMIKYDYIGYLEDIGTAYQVVKNKVFSDLDIDLGERYAGSSGSAGTIEAYKVVPKHVLDAIVAKFEDDFNIGGYSTDINCIDQLHG